MAQAAAQDITLLVLNQLENRVVRILAGVVEELVALVANHLEAAAAVLEL
jgi:hypothetical protein